MQARKTNQDFIAVICNVNAGKGRAASMLGKIGQALQNAGKKFQIFVTEWPTFLDPFESIWLIGGDGTLNYFLNRYPAINIPLALFAGGSGNDFYWKLTNNRSFEKQLSIAVQGCYKAVDAGICNGRVFINGFGLGFDAEIVRSLRFKTKLSAGHLAYLIVVLKKIFFFREKQAFITLNGITVCKSFFMITVANGSRYGGGFLVAPKAIIDDRFLDFVSIDAMPPLRRIFYLTQVQKGMHLQHAFVTHQRIEEILIEAPSPMAAHLDGEYLEATRFEIKIMPERFLFIG